MNTLHVLLPPMRRVQDDPALRAWLARGDRLPQIRAARTAVLRECFQFAGDAVPAAALRHHCHAGDTERGVWLCADPAWVRSEATGARLMACPVDDVSAADADELAVALRPLFDEAAVLVVDTPSTWNVRLAGDARVAAFTNPADALGVSLIDVLPDGEAGRAWRRLFNEVQILLHAHPVNARRIAAGKTPVNALWFWGEGALPDSVETGLRYVASTDDVLRGLAKMAGAIRLEPLPQALEAVGKAGDVLLDLEMPDGLDRISDWLPSFRRWLREKRFGAISLVFAGGERFRVRHAHRLRFWVGQRV